MKMKEILRAHVRMMDCRVMLGEVLCKVISPKKPMDVKFTLVFTIFYPIYTHADGFRPALFHGAMDNTLGADVVNL